MQLRLGKMPTKDLADWFGISYDRLRHDLPKKLEILSQYCKFKKYRGGIEIESISIDTYCGDLSKADMQNYLKEIQESDNKLSSVAGMARKFKHFNDEYKQVEERTIYKRLDKVGKINFGATKTKKEAGTAGLYGSRRAVLAVMLDEYNHYRELNKDEWDTLMDIIKKYADNNPDKLLYEGMLEEEFRNSEMTKEEYFKTKDSQKWNSFEIYQRYFTEKTGYKLVVCQKHEIFDFASGAATKTTLSA